MDLPVLPPRPVESFPTFASSIESDILSEKPSEKPSSHEGRKRPKDSTQHAIEALNHAITKQERVEALNVAFMNFSHNNIHQHDYEIQMGADKALCLKLGYVVVASNSPWDELELIGKCLLQVYQCTAEQRKRSFRNIGSTELIPLLVQVLMKSLLLKRASIPCQEESVLVTVAKVLRIYTKLESAKSLLIQLNHGAWLGQILRHCVAVLGTKSMVSHLCMELLGLVKDLTFRSSPSDKERILSLSDGIFGGLLATICRTGTSNEKQIVEWFTAVIWNLVLEKRLCDQIMENERIHDFPIIRYLLHIFENGALRHNSSFELKIRRNAVSSIGNILAHVDCQKLIFCDANRPKLETLAILLKMVETDDDSIVRRRAMRTIRCLASSECVEVQASISQVDLPTFLVEAISRSISMDDENDRDMQIQACQTICAVIDRLAGADWPCIETALLQRVETSNDTKLIHAACSCLAECVKKSPWHRGASCFSDMFWTRLEATAASDKESHDSIATLLHELAHMENEQGEESTSNMPSNLTSSQVINTINHLISREGSGQQKTIETALQTIVLLVQREANRKPLAENESLLSGLVNLCLLQADAGTKDSAKQVIISLVPEL